LVPGEGGELRADTSTQVSDAMSSGRRVDGTRCRDQTDASHDDAPLGGAGLTAVEHATFAAGCFVSGSMWTYRCGI
jgi:hypothetical protein